MLDGYYVDEIVAAVVRTEGINYVKAKSKSFKINKIDLLDLIKVFDKYPNFPAVKEARSSVERSFGKIDVPGNYRGKDLVPKKAVEDNRLVEISNELEMIDYECKLAKGLIKAHHILRYKNEFSAKFIKGLNDGIAKGKKSRVYQITTLADNLELAFEEKKKDIRVNP
ncbi:hypothetical protein GF361_05120 [Candidatus Woesearchaeota archaeon]|nr:hypothetical protein [Candidatus Woesearchaeota archaeon]